MPIKSTVKTKLPPEVLQELNQKLIDGNLTIDQLVDFLKTKVDSPPSRSAIGRYAKDFEKTAKHLREGREIARAMSQQIGNGLEFDQGRLLVEMMRGLAFDVVFKLRSGDKTVNLDKLWKLARILKDLSQSVHFEYEAIKKIREDERHKVEMEIKEKIVKMGKAKDLKALSDEELERRIKQLVSREGAEAA